MLEAIYRGLFYGIIAGFSTVGFIAVLSFAWFIIELIDRVYDYAVGGNGNDDRASTTRS